MDRYLRKASHFWKIFMTRGQNKCIAGFLNKGDPETTFIAPDNLEKTFEEIGIANNCQITLFEIRGIPSQVSNLGEEGEMEMEEMEAEIDEMEEGAGEVQAEGEVAAVEGVAQVVEESEDADIKKKASDVLFNDQNDKA